MKVEAKPSEAINIMRIARAAKRCLAIWGPPGVGKSVLLQDFAADNKLRFIDTRLAYSAPTDVKGFPFTAKDANGEVRMRFAIPDEFPTEPGNLWAFEELPCASKATQNCALELFLEGRIGRYECPEDTFLCITGNRPEDRAFVEKLSPALINRMTIITLKTDLEDWIDWAITNQIDTTVMAFIKFRPGLLHDFSGPEWDGISPFASPRSWEFVSQIIKESGIGKQDSHTRFLMCAGSVGQGAASEYEGFLKVYEQLPAIEAALRDPKGTDVPEETSAKYAMVAALSQRVEKKNFKNALIYLGRMTKEFEVFAVKMVFKRDPDLCNTSEFAEWVQRNKGVFTNA